MRIRGKASIMSLALGLGLFIWLVDGLLDYLIFFRGHGTLLQLLFTEIPNHELYIRCIIVLCFLGFGLVVSAVTERLDKARDEAEKSEQWLYTTLRSIGDGVIATDDQERVTFLNRAAEEMTGWSHEEARGLPLARVFHIINAKTGETQANPVGKVLKTGKVVGLANHTVLLSRHGRETQIADSAAGIFDAQKQISGVVLAFRDVTAEYLAREELRRSEEKFRILFESNPSGLALVDTVTQRIVQANRSFLEIVGYGPEDMNELTVKDITHPDDWGEESATIREHLERDKNGIYSLTKRYLTKDGRVRWVRVRGEMLFLQGDQTPMAIASVEDITERKQAQDALAESEERIRILFEQAADAMYLFDHKGRLVEVNQVACRATGYAREELLELKVTDVEAEITTNAALKEILGKTSPGNPESITSRHRRKDGSTYPVEVTLGALETSQGGLYLGIARDISRRLEREILYSQILKTAHDGFWLVDEKGILIDCNKAAAEMLGYSVQEMLGKSVWDLDDNKHPQNAAERMRKVREMGSYRFETTHRRKDGKSVAVEISTSYTQIGGGSYVVFVSDVTHRREAEKAIAENEERLRTVLENLADGVFAHDLDGNIIMVNQAACRNTGYLRHELLGMKVADLDHASVTRKDRENLWLRMSRGKSFKVESYHRRKDGGEYPAEIRLSAFTLREEPLILALAQDITERKKAEAEKAALESQLRQAQKMEAVGTLAGGIAHDFNNILSAITGYSELALDATLEGDAPADEIRQVLNAADRAKKLVQQILAFSRKGAMENKPFNINTVIADAAQILGPTLPKMIELDIRAGKGLRLTSGDPNQIEQVILNLASNAQAAMPEGGRLVIETRNETLDRKYSSSHLGSIPGEYVELVVSDNGVGIEPQVMEHIFEPFFTTKGVGKGTGLGLASAYGIVKSHQGYITCESKPGEGTAFRIFLPALSVPGRVTGSKPDSRGDVKGGDETILLVDDEDALRNLARRFLERRGYRVVCASNGEEALEAYRRENGKIDLVVMDLSMPGMGGRKAIREIRSLDPGAKVVIASGYSSDGQKGDIPEGEVQDYIAKPFRRDELLSSVRRVLDSADEPPAVN